MASIKTLKDYNENIIITNTISDYVNEGEYTPQSATEVRYIDYVFLKGTDKCYRVQYASQIPSHSGVTNGKVTVPAGDNYKPDTSEYWVEASSQEFAYIKDLVAKQISAQTVSADEFLVKRKLTNGSTQIVGGMVKGDTNTTKEEENIVFFAGTSAADTSDLNDKLNTKEAKTYITEGGKLHSENADITGKVQASQLVVKANPTNLTQNDKVTPSIIFTTYKKSAIIYSYKKDGTPITNTADANKPASMESFTNLKDSNGGSLAEGSPVGIVYSLNSNNIYVPTYFFDFAPLIVNRYTTISFDSTPWGSEITLLQDKDTKLVYSGDTDNPVLYSGEVYLNFYGYAFEYIHHLTDDMNILHAVKGARKIRITNGRINYTTEKVYMKFNRTLVPTEYTANDINIKYDAYDIFVLENNTSGIASVNSNITINGKNESSSGSNYPTSRDEYTMQIFMADNYGLVPYVRGIGDEIPPELVNKTLYMAVPLALGGIYCETSLENSNPNNKVFVLDNNYITNTSDTIMSFTTGTTTPIDNSELQGIMYINQPYNNHNLDTAICIGITIPGYDKNSNTSNIG